MFKKVKWKKYEDEILKSGVSKYGINSWKKISTLFTNKSEIQCKDRFNNEIMRDGSCFSESENNKLLQLSKKFENQFNTICEEMNSNFNKFRTPIELYEQIKFLLTKKKSPVNIHKESNESSDYEKDYKLMTQKRLQNTENKKKLRKKFYREFYKNKKNGR